LLDFRRVGCWYLKRCVGAKPLRIQLNKSLTTAEVFSTLDEFPWESLSLSQENLFTEAEA
jgi:hypothetical protein